MFIVSQDGARCVEVKELSYKTFEFADDTYVDIFVNDELFATYEAVEVGKGVFDTLVRSLSSVKVMDLSKMQWYGRG